MQVEVGHDFPQGGTGLKSKSYPLVVVAVDGPAGSGKSSICSDVAAKLGWMYLNTGALYRATGIIAEDLNVDLNSEVAVAELMNQLAQGLRWDVKDRNLYFQERNLTPLLGLEKTGIAASRVATNKWVRAGLLPLQQDLVLKSGAEGALVDGRDIGTVVFPDADLKIFLTASLEERARRRMEQLKGSGKVVPDLEEIKSEMAARDSQDGSRDAAPLKQADDAQILDTSSIDVQGTIDAILSMIHGLSE